MAKKTPVVPHGHRNTPLIAWKMHVSWDMPMTVTCGVRDGSGGGVHTETTGIYHLVIYHSYGKSIINGGF